MRGGLSEYYGVLSRLQPQTITDFTSHTRGEADQSLPTETAGRTKASHTRGETESNHSLQKQVEELQQQLSQQTSD